MYSYQEDDTRPSLNNLGGIHDENGYRTGAENDRQNSDTAAVLEDALSPEHLRMLLEESGIAPDVVETRGYRTVKAKA